MADQWYPIETAPKDGTMILVCAYSPDHPQYYSPRSGCWATYHPNAKGKAFWRTDRICGDKMNPTHWMPLPDVPEQKGTNHD